MLSLITSALFARAAAPLVPKPTFHSSLKTASEAATPNQSLVLLIFSAEWCGPCKALKKTTLDTKEFLDGGGPLCVNDVDIDADQKTARAFTVNAVPTLVLLTADGKIVSRRTGYVEAAELLKWIEAGRRRAQAGQWEGTAPGTKIDEFAAKVSGAGLNTNDLKRLIGLLGESDPADRTAAAKLLLDQREQAMPALIEAVSDPYLGVRIGVSELLHTLAPEASPVDPWRSAADLTSVVATLRTWWAQSGKLTAPGARRADATVEGSVKAALAALREEDAVRRTEAMSTLVAQGLAALPAVREAIKRSERTEPRAVALLEDVRWAILVSDSVEKRTDGVRQALARGTSPERQTAATRLGRIGRDAVEALAELADDSDPLVVEGAIRALATIGGADVIGTMATLLKASDNNLRMTAAQALGHTKDSKAIKPLLTVLNDPNEIVACAALAALEEISAKEAYFNQSPGAKETLAPETLAALKRSLSDPRWRVRATGVEVIGKLKVSELTTDAKALLDDPDAFVVKNTLVALPWLNATPDTPRLVALARRMPSLRGDALQVMVRSASPETVAAVEGMYGEGNTEERVTVLSALRYRDRFERRTVDEAWRPLLAKAMTAKEAPLRQAVAGLLSLCTVEMAAQLVGPLLADPDEGTRVAAAAVVLEVIAGRMSGAPLSAGPNLTYKDGKLVEMAGVKTNRSPASAERLALWHSNLLQHAGTHLEPSVAAAVYATGDAKKEVTFLATALTDLDEKEMKRLAAVPAFEVILPKLPWPEGKTVIDKLCLAPGLFARAAMESDRAEPAVAEYLLEPARFKAVVERATTEELMTILPRLLGTVYAGERTGWSLLAPSAPAGAIVAALLDSTNAAWRAAAVYTLGRREPQSHLAVLEKALQDPSPWVRASAVRSLARALPERAAFEQRVGPLVADGDEHVAAIAAMGLLEPGVRAAAGLQWQFSYFRFEDVHAIPSEAIPSDENQPLATLGTQPPFLEPARRWLTATNELRATVFALLLAQHGQFDGVERLLAQRSEPLRAQEDRVLMDPLLTGVALSRDAKYVPFLRRLSETMTQPYDWQKILRALKEMKGSEVQALRLEVNKKISPANGTTIPIKTAEIK